MKIGAGEFKTKCLKLMDTVAEFHEEIIITKHGKPIAKLVPVGPKQEKSLYGYMQGSMTIKGDIVKSTGEKWDADS